MKKENATPPAPQCILGSSTFCTLFTMLLACAVGLVLGIAVYGQFFSNFTEYRAQHVTFVDFVKDFNTGETLLTVDTGSGRELHRLAGHINWPQQIKTGDILILSLEDTYRVRGGRKWLQTTALDSFDYLTISRISPSVFGDVYRNIYRKR